MTADEMYSRVSENTYVRLGIVVALVVFSFGVGAYQTGQRKMLEQTQKDIAEIKQLLQNNKRDMMSRLEVDHWVVEFRRMNPTLSVPDILPRRKD